MRILHWAFNLHSSDDEEGWTSLYMFADHLFPPYPSWQVCSLLTCVLEVSPFLQLLPQSPTKSSPGSVPALCSLCQKHTFLTTVDLVGICCSITTLFQEYFGDSWPLTHRIHFKRIHQVLGKSFLFFLPHPSFSKYISFLWVIFLLP